MHFKFTLLVTAIFLTLAPGALAARTAPMALPTIAGYASTIAGQPVTITCTSAIPSGDWGFTPFANGHALPVIELRPAACRRLERARSYWSIVPADFLTLEHEAQHIAMDSLNECDVESVARANVWTLLRQFHLSAWRDQIILSGIGDADAALPAAYHEGCS